MELKDAYAVYINFDDDIRSDAEGFRIFAGEKAREEVRELVRTALKDMARHEKERRGIDINVWIESAWGDVKVEDVINNDKYLDDFIYCGGSSFGNWDIEVSKS